MPEPTRTQPESNWPLRLTYHEVADAIAALGITVAGTSPVARFIDGHRPTMGTPASAVAVDAAEALQLLAAPVRLVLLTVRHREERFMFVSDDSRLLRFDIGSEGCLVSEPVRIDAFADLICDLAEASESDAAPIAIGHRFLKTIQALRRYGLFGPAAAIGVRVAEAAIASAVEVDVDAHTLLLALQDDGVITIRDASVVPDPNWSQRYPYLLDDPTLELSCYELADSDEERRRPKTLAVLGDRDRRVLFTPALPERRQGDALLELVPATRDYIRRAVAELVGPPLAPPSSPVVAYAGDPTALAEGGDDLSARDWRRDYFADLAVSYRADPGPLRAMFRPGATIAVVSAPREGVSERHVLGLADDQAIEWTVDGSRIRWREIPVSSVLAGVEALLPPTASGPTLECRVSSRELGETFRAGTAAESGTLGERCWSVVALRSSGTTYSGTQLLLAADGDGRAWRLEPDADEYAARTVEVGEIRRELVAALTSAGDL